MQLAAWRPWHIHINKGLCCIKSEIMPVSPLHFPSPCGTPCHHVAAAPAAKWKSLLFQEYVTTRACDGLGLSSVERRGSWWSESRPGKPLPQARALGCVHCSVPAPSTAPGVWWGSGSMSRVDGMGRGDQGRSALSWEERKKLRGIVWGDSAELFPS